MTDQYIGSAGNLNRLFIPSLGQVQDPDTQRALQAILQWANSLDAVIQLLAGSGITISPTDGEGIVTVSGTGGVGSLVNWAFYGYNQTSISAGGKITFTPIFSNNFAYTAATDFVFPDDTISILNFNGAAIMNATPEDIGIDLIDTASNIYGETEVQIPSTTASFVGNIAIPAGYNSADGTQPLHYKTNVSTNPPTQIIGTLFIASFTTP
jgi:hypothetical protein